jgi:hypothetical protein
MTLDLSATGGGPLAGGSMTLDGFVITIPKNILVTLPSITVAWPELFDNTTSPPTPKLPGSVTWEAHVSLLTSLL